MQHEFDDSAWPVARAGSRQAGGAATSTVPRLVGRIYSAGDAPLRARLLGGLLRPLGPLGLAAVAAGAFADFLQRRSAEGFQVTLDDASRYSAGQIAELVRFVGQVSPDAVQSVVATLADNPVGVTAFGASALVLLMRAMRRPADGPGAHR